MGDLKSLNLLHAHERTRGIYMTTSFPSTGKFPAEPTVLERDELDAVYLELRKSYRSLMVSRGLYRGKADRNRAAMQQPLPSWY